MGSVRRRPDGKWRARYRDPAGREHARHFRRKIDAERWLASTETSKARGEWIDPALARMTVGEWATRWLDAQVHLKPSTAARYRGVIDCQIRPTWDRVQIGRVTHEAVAAWVVELVKSGLSARSVHKAHRVLSMVLDLAVRDRRIPFNPASGVPLPRAGRTAKRYLSARQVHELAEAAGRDKVIVYVLAYVGLRFGELAALRVGDLDIDRRRLRIERSVTDVNGKLVEGSPKTHRHREVVLPAFVAALVANHAMDKLPGDLLFPSHAGTILRANNFRRYSFDRAARTVGIPGLTPHELRHTAASLAVSAGANVKAVQHMLGHASAAMTLDVYAGLFGDDLDALAERLDRLAAGLDADQMRTTSRAGDAPTESRSAVYGH
jgi:integrase